MDVSRYLELRIAPRAVFDSLPWRGSRARFMLPTPEGDWQAVTWRAFADQIRNAALFLLGEGLEPEDRAVVFAGNRVEWGSAALAIQAAGGAIVPLYPNSTREQAAYVVEHSDARFLFVDGAALLARVFEGWPAYANVERIVLLDDGLDPMRVLEKVRAGAAKSGAEPPTFAEMSRRVVSWSSAQAYGAALHRLEPARFERTMHGVSLDQVGMMLYTSGTTGNPKGVPLTHYNVGVNGRDWVKNNAPLLDEDAVDLLWLPMSHIFGFGELCLGNTLGFTSYFADPLTVLQRMPEVRPAVFMSVPRYWEKLAAAAMAEPTPEAQKARLAEVTGGRLKFCLSGGAGLKQEVKEFFYEQGILIIEGYGLTEASPTLTMNSPDAFRFDSVGRPYPSVELKLAEDGEILAKADSIFKGYHKDPEATKEVFTEDGWLKTGDIGRFTEDGFLQIIDRKKEILVTAGGKNIPPRNIELHFEGDPFIAHLVVYGDAKPYLVAGVWLWEELLQQHLAAEGVPEPERAAAREALVRERVEAVNEKLARHETVKRWKLMERPLTVENGLLTPTLKVKRKKVYEAFRGDFEGLYA